MRAAFSVEMDCHVSHDEINEKVQNIASSFLTHSALIGVCMFFTIAMLIDRVGAAWPDPAAVAVAAGVWGLALALLYLLFERVRGRTALHLQQTLRTWYLRGPGARGATVIEAEPLGITYEYLGRRKRAAIEFLWSRIEFVAGSATPPGDTPRSSWS